MIGRQQTGENIENPVSRTRQAKVGRLLNILDNTLQGCRLYTLILGTKRERSTTAYGSVSSLTNYYTIQQNVFYFLLHVWM